MSKLQKMSETGDCPGGGNAKGRRNGAVLYNMFPKGLNLSKSLKYEHRPKKAIGRNTWGRLFQAEGAEVLRPCDRQDSAWPVEGLGRKSEGWSSVSEEQSRGHKRARPCCSGTVQGH